MEKLAIICVTEHGYSIAKNIEENINGQYDVSIYKREIVKEKGIKLITEEVFKSFSNIIFISSTGIAVRSIAPFIQSKVNDPAILVIDNSSKYVISLLSGHLGGANELTLKVAEILKSQPIITTATDNMNIEAPDIISKKHDLMIDNMKICKNIAAALVQGGKVGFIDYNNEVEVPKGYEKYKEHNEYEALVVITNENNIKTYGNIDSNNILKLVRRNIVLGIGCRKNYDSDTMEQKVMEKLKELNIDKRSVKSIGTAWVKSEENAIINLSRKLQCPMKVFSKEDIEKIDYKYNGSDFVYKTIGVRAVCEPCVELLNGELLTDKLSMDGMTLCIGRTKV